MPGGYMFHKIDLSDENMFSSRGMHPLTFLTISEGVYRLMAADSGKPNRKLINYYRQKMLEYSLNGKIFVTSILGQGPLIPHKEFVSPGVDYSDMQTKLIGKIRPKLTDTFRALPDSDLIPTGIFLIAQKPPHQLS